MSKVESEFKLIHNNVMKCYNDEIFNYLESKPTGSLTNSDVIIMIMNLTVSISTNVYYSLKKFLPETQINFDFVKATVINNLVDSFEKIKSYDPANDLIQLTEEQSKEIKEKGSVTISTKEGEEINVIKEDLIVKKDDVKKIIDNGNKKIIGAHDKKIVVPNNRRN